ncbi:sporulation membrane protein YtaF [Bacillus sp. FJAT-44742]|uniref:sporulation membrane protein YtaF n=1 Tax=Bacillus sp. FJAT-44742 TaxID=2014005 RepID=UPI000C232DFD|nr:sporulation membrane protein YtaF [Bacillus sp. FJAT-44742]
MAEVLSLLVLAFAVSLDSFGVGLTYGLRKMKLPLRALIFIAGCSAVSVLIASGFGTIIQRYVSSDFAESVGGIILIMIGVWAIYQVLKPSEGKEEQQKTVKEKDGFFINFEIKWLGLVISILKKPTAADVDGSGTISLREAFLLGIALSLDAFGAGIGASLIGISPIFLAGTVAFMCAFFVTLGMKGGYRLSGVNWVKSMSFLPGVLLIVLGVLNL